MRFKNASFGAPSGGRELSFSQPRIMTAASPSGSPGGGGGGGGNGQCQHDWQPTYLAKTLQTCRKCGKPRTFLDD